MPDYLNAVVDLSHWNGNPDLQAANRAGIAGIIQKATQGTNSKDVTFQQNRQKTTDAGMMFGAYHFGSNADGHAQADWFLNTVKPDAHTLVALDFEVNPRAGNMTIAQAHDFVQHIFNVLGRWPVFYSGFYHMQERIGIQKDALLGKCPFWLAAYTTHPHVPPTWDHWTMWQYSEGIHGFDPHITPGIGRCDKNFFYSDMAALRKFWGY